MRVEKRPAPPYPDLQWQGAAPTGVLEDDPWVKAARKSLGAQAVAQNITDFTLPELVETTGANLRSRLAGPAFEAVKQKKRPKILPGPDPFVPVELTPSASGKKAELSGCIARWGPETGEVPADLTAYGVMFRLEKLTGGQLRIEQVLGLPQLDCSRVEVPVGLFDPAPEPSDVTDAKDIVRAERTDIDRR